MKVIAPSFTILDDLDRQSLPVRIEHCGRICYKSETRIDAQSAIPFVKKMAENKHLSVLEMGVLSFRVQCSEAAWLDLLSSYPNFLQIDMLNNGKRSAEKDLLITGSVRAFAELYAKHTDNAVIRALCTYIVQEHPYFFSTALAEQEADGVGISSDQGVTFSHVPLSEIEQIPAPLLARHRYLAVRFVVNRAVSHELVRHRPCSFLQESQRYCRYGADRFGNEVTFIKPCFFSQESDEYAQWKKAMEDAESCYLRLLEKVTPQAARTVLPNSCKTEIIVYANLQEWGHILALRTPKAADPSMREVMVPLQEALQKRYPTLFSTS